MPELHTRTAELFAPYPAPPRLAPSDQADGLRRLKDMFHEYEATASRIARENERLVAFQREGAGLPQGARPGG